MSRFYQDDTTTIFFNGEGYESNNDTNLIYNNDSC